MADDLRDRGITKEQALQFVESITGQRFTDLGDPAISAAMARANMAAEGDPVGSCVYTTADGQLQCQDNTTEAQCTDSFSGTWDPDVTCQFRNDFPPGRHPGSSGMAAPIAPPAETPMRRAAKPATKKPAKKRAPARAAKRASAAARTKPKKKKVAAKAKRRPAKAAAKKKTKRPAKKGKRR